MSLTIIGALSAVASAQAPPISQDAADDVAPEGAGRDDASREKKPPGSEREEGEESVYLPKPPGEELTPEEAALLEGHTGKKSLHDDFSFKVGPSFHVLFDSYQARPFTYPSLGMRKKSARFYFDLQIPILLGAIDAALYFFRRDILRTNEAINLFETLNQPRQYVFFEALHLKLGPTWRRHTERDGRASKQFDLSVGAVGVADWVVFDAKLLGGPIPDDADINDVVRRDPVVVGAGLFGAIGAVRGPASTDLALEVARDLLDWGAYEPASGWIISLDLDNQLKITEDLALSTRARLSTYTHVPETRIFSISFTTGVSFRF